MTIDMSQFYQVFFEEAAEHLGTMENLLLSLDVDHPDTEDLHAIFRAAHSIKGGSATFGFTDMTEVTHILETLLDQLRNGERALRSDMVDAFLQAGDVLRNQLDAHQSSGEADRDAAAAVCTVLRGLAQEQGQSAGESPASADEPPAGLPGYRIVLTPEAGRARPIDPEAIAAELAGLGQVEIQSEGNSQIFLLSAACDIEAIKEIFDFVASADEYTITPSGAEEETSPTAAGEGKDEESYGFFVDDEELAQGKEAQQGYGFFDENPGQPEAMPPPSEDDKGYGFFVDEKQLDAGKEKEQGFGFFVDEKELPAAKAPGGEPSPAKAATPAPVEEKPKTPPPGRGGEKSGGDSSIRVSVEKVDQLINLVGELVITQAMLAQNATKLTPEIFETLQVPLSQLEHNTRDLQESVMSIRMMPISFVFSRFPRVVRDLSSKLRKQVELRTIGEGTELDKGLIEKLSDPLTHLVRNSLDHGIEKPEDRIAAGKPEKGTITLRAAHLGGNIVIEVLDDGAGLDRERILGKARERGMTVSDSMSDSEVWQLIFEPGFSTAEVVTDVSGRGVGMDVVKKNIVHGMGGRIEIESQKGYGTRIIIRLPLTLAILDGMSISVGAEIFIIPLTFIVESLKPEASDIKTVSGHGRVLHVRGEYLPLVPLRNIFNIDSPVLNPEDGILVLVEAEGRKIALFVDDLVGQHQVVIKSLETNFRKVLGVSGATIMGDGRVALILDISSLVRMSQT